MERTRNVRLKSVTFDYDLDLEFTWQSYGFGILFH